MKIIGHRGSSYKYPENTQISIIKAFEKNADGVEIDINKSIDNILFLLHDTTLQRTSNNDIIIKNNSYKYILENQVNTLKFNEEISLIDIGSWKDIQFKNQFPITLKTAINLIPNNKIVMIELKYNKLDIIKLLESYIINSTKRIIFVGFNFDLMVHVKKFFTTFKVYYILEATTTKLTIDAIDNCYQNKLDGISLQADIELVSSDIIKYSKNKNLDIAIWVSNKIENSDTEETANIFKKRGVDYFITNQPEKYII